MNKIYSKPELEIEKFEVADVITLSNPTVIDPEAGIGELSAGMEFSIDLNGNDEF